MYFNSTSVNSWSWLHYYSTEYDSGALRWQKINHDCLNAYSGRKKVPIGKRTRPSSRVGIPSRGLVGLCYSRLAAASSNIQFVETMGSKPRIAYYGGAPPLDGASGLALELTGSMTQFNFLVIIFTRPFTKPKTRENWISMSYAHYVKKSCQFANKDDLLRKYAQ